MGSKVPEQFKTGDVISNVRTTPYSGSPIIKAEDMGDERTQVTFENGEVVEFFNGIDHEMQE